MFFFYSGKIWPVGQLSTWTLLLQRHAVAVDAVCGLALSCSNMERLSRVRRHLDGSTCHPKSCVYTFQHWWWLSKCTLTLMYTKDAYFWTERRSKLDAPSALWCCLQKDFQISIRLTTEQLSIFPQSILNELRLGDDGGIFGPSHSFWRFCRHFFFFFLLLHSLRNTWDNPQGWYSCMRIFYKLLFLLQRKL